MHSAPPQLGAPPSGAGHPLPELVLAALVLPAVVLPETVLAVVALPPAPAPVVELLEEDPPEHAP